MNTSDVFEPAVVETTCRPRLTRNVTGGLLWSEEWRRHRVAFSQGLAFWIWLFLIPGETTHLNWVLSFSVLLAGLFGSRIGGYDLEHGVDPLIRTLAPPLMTRWIIRAGVVVAAGLTFYILGSIACEWRWANEVWGLVAKGPFTDDPAAGRAPFGLLEALPIICAVGLSTFAFTSRFNGVGPTILIVLFIIAVVIGVITVEVAGESLVVRLGLFLLNPETNSPSSRHRFSVEQVKLLLGLTAVAWSGIIVFVGGLRYARRGSIETSGRVTGSRWHWLPTAVLAALTAIWDVAGTLSAVDTGGNAGRSETAIREWCLVGMQLSLFGLWVCRAKPWREPLCPSSNFPAHSRASLWLRNAWVVVCLGVIGSSLHTRATRPLTLLTETWPAPLPKPVVNSSLTFNEAEAMKHRSIAVHAFDVIAWIAYQTQPNQPLVIGQTVLEVPAVSAVSETAVTLELPGFLKTDTSATVVVKARLDRSHSRDAEARRASHLREREILEWSSAVPRGAPATNKGWTTAATWGGNADDIPWIGATRMRRSLIVPGSDGPELAAGFLLIPQKPGAERQLHPWSDFFTARMLSVPEAGRTPYRQPPPRGVLGLWTDDAESAGLSQMRLPLCILLTLIAVSCRHWLLGWVAVVAALLVTLIGVDAALHRQLRRITGNPGLPLAQRIEAHKTSRLSYFHGAFQGPLPR